MFIVELANAIYIWFTKTKSTTDIWTININIFVSSRKIDLGKKEKPNKIDEDLNNNLEDLLKDLSSQFRA